MKRYLLHLFLVLALITGGIGVPASAEQASGGYVEEELVLPDGYMAATPPVATPDGGFAVAAARGDTRAWALIAWADVHAEPSVTPLGAVPGYISSIDYAPDGQMLAVCDPENAVAGQKSGPVASGEPSAAGVPDKAVSDSQASGGGSGPVLSGEPSAAGVSDNIVPDAQASGGDSGPAPAGKPSDFLQDASPKQASGGEGKRAARMFSTDDRKTALAWLNPDGGVAETFELSGMLQMVRALSGRRAAVLALGAGVSIYSDSGEKLAEIAGDEFFGLAADADSLWLQRKGALAQVGADGVEARSVPLTAAFGSPIAVAGDGTVYVVSAAGIEKLTSGGEAFEKIADASDYAFGDPSEFLSGLCALKDGTLVAMLGGGNGVYVSSSGGKVGIGFNVSGGGEASRLMAYVFDPNLDLSSREDFTVTALRASAKLRKAVSEFQRAHPELSVKLNAKLDENDTETPVEDAVRALNTDILAGNGGDVLVLDGLPAEKFAQKGVLQDLTQFAGGLGMLPGILNGSKARDGKLYALPAQFAFTVLWGRRDQADKVTGLTSLPDIELADGQTPMFGRTPEDWLRLFFPASEDALRDETGKPRFDSEAFAAFLNAIDRLYAAQAEQPDAPADGRLNMEELQALMNGSVALAPGEIASTMQAAIYYTTSGEKDAYPLLVPSVGGSGAAYSPSLLMGVNARTSRRDLAEAFIRSMFSSELQELEQSEGLPTVADSLDRLVENAKALSKNKDIMMAISLDGSTPLELVQPDDACWDALRALCDRLTTSAPVDETLLSFLSEETAAFFSGSASAQEAARAVAARAMAYLNE